MELKGFITSICTIPNENIWLVKNKFYALEESPFDDFYYVVAESDAENFRKTHNIENYQFEKCYSPEILEEYFGDMVAKMSISEHRRFLNSIIPRYNDYATSWKTDEINIPSPDVSIYGGYVAPKIEWGVMPHENLRMWTSYGE